MGDNHAKKDEEAKETFKLKDHIVIL